MFRRKEEGLFDSDIDQDQTQNESAQDDKSASQQATSSFNTSSTAHSASSSPAASSTSNAQAAARPNNPAAPTANSFRPATATSPAAPLAADLTRNRLPEAKQPAASVTASFATPLPMPGSDKSKSVKRVLTVGNDILLKGEIATCDRLVIEGKVDATLNDVHTVEIAECGSFKGSAQIEDAEISGLFEGELTVRGRLVIYATGKVRGKISYGEIEIERGGELTGEIKMAGATAAAARPIVRNNALKDDRVAA